MKILFDNLDQTEINERCSKTFTMNIDPSKIFHNELCQSIEEIREKYQSFIDEQQFSFQNQYRISLKQFSMEKYFFQLNLIRIEKNKEQSNKFRQMIIQTTNENLHLKKQNDHLNNQIQHFQTLINTFKLKSSSFFEFVFFLKNVDLHHLDEQKANEQLKEIEQAKAHLRRLDENVNEITTTRFSLEEQINTYKELLQGRRGLQFHIDRVIRGIHLKTGMHLSRALYPIWICLI